MKANKKVFYITTTIPYVNASPHIGFALEVVLADIYARYHSVLGEEVFFNFGSDEHGVKIYRKAIEEKKEPKVYVDEYALKFEALRSVLNLSYTAFVRTTSPHHKLAAQKFWERCVDTGDIYKKNYKIKYCVGCELEKTDSELDMGRCLLHPNIDIETIDEENYFFRFSKYQNALLELYKNKPDFIVPGFRFNEIIKFIESGVEDFSISRLKEKMPWGVDVPNDNDHVMYVWFDALVNYISTLGWPENENEFSKFWGTKDSPNALQIAGKDQIRQQAAMWQAMLMSADLPCTKQIIIHGFITSGGQKMSKSLGNVVDPADVVNEYGTDALRYFLARHINPFEDSDFTRERFKEVYNANLANGLGNLVSRIMQLAETHLKEPVKIDSFEFPKDFTEALKDFEINKASDFVWHTIQKIDQKINSTEPFKIIKTDFEKGVDIIEELVKDLSLVSRMLEPIIPQSAEKIINAIKENKKPENLFPRKD